MNKKVIFCIIIFFAFSVSENDSFSAPPVLHKPGYSIELVASGLGAATGITIGPTGDIFLTDYQDVGPSRILRVDSSTYTVNQYATGFSFSSDLAFDSSGRLFVLTGSGNPRHIYEVFSDGSSSLFATGFSFTTSIEYYGGYIYLGNSGDGTISRVNVSTGLSEPFLSGYLGPHGPFGLSIDDSGNLYFAVHGSGQIYTSTQGKNVSLLATLSPLGPQFTETDSSGVVYVTDPSSAAIFTIEEGTVSLFASGFVGKSNPPAIGPNGMAFDSYGNLYVGDGEYLWKISLITTPIAVDIKPVSCPNPLNKKSRGVIPVAILGTVDVDVTQIDVSTVKLEGVSPVRSNLEDVATPFEPYTDKEDCFLDCTDSLPDGFMDLTLKFKTQDIIAAIGPVRDGECKVLHLTGSLQETFGGTPLEGEDVVIILKKGK